jgi:hypothetical protein
MPHPCHSALFANHNIWQEVQITKLVSSYFTPPVFTSYLLGLDILISAIFQTPSVYVRPLIAKDQVSHQYRTAVRVIQDLRFLRNVG